MCTHMPTKTFDLWPQVAWGANITFDLWPHFLSDHWYASDSAEIIAAWTYKRFATPTLGVLLFSYCPYIITMWLSAYSPTEELNGRLCLMIDFFVCSYRLSDTSTFSALEDLVVNIYQFFFAYIHSNTCLIRCKRKFFITACFLRMSVWTCIVSEYRCLTLVAL